MPLHLVLLVTAALTSVNPTHTDSDGFVTVVDLISIGPGQHLWTSFGHSALMVMRFNPETKENESIVYNWGDADFGGWDFVFGFLRGKSKFRIVSLGSLEDVVNLYARAGRQVYQQRLAISSEKAAYLGRRLAFHARPENRDYVYHHLNATCATKIRDFVDKEVAQGAIKKTFENTIDPMSPREYGRRYFAGFFLAELFNDTFMGRYHDEPWSKFAAMAVPANLSAYLREVMIDDPKGGQEKVALLAPMTPVVQGIPGPPYRGEGRSMFHVIYLLMVVVGGFGLITVTRKQVVPAYAGMWLLSWSLLTTFAAACMVFGASISTVIEGRVNELMLVFPITDVVLIPFAVRWWFGSAKVPTWLRTYGHIRLGMVVLSLVLHAVGIFVQEPVVIVYFGLVCASLLVAILQRLPKSVETSAAIPGASAVARAA